MTSLQPDVQLGQLLIERDLIDVSALEEGLARQVTHGGRIGCNLIELGSVSIEAVADALSIQLGVPAADLQGLQIDERTLQVIPGSLCDKYKILPLRLQDGTLHLAMQDPRRDDLIRHLSSALRVRIQAYVTPQLRLLYLLERYYGIERPRRYVRDPSQGQPDHRRTYLQATVGQPEARGVAPGGAPTVPPVASEVAAHVRPQSNTESVVTDTSQYELVYLDDAPRAPRSPTDLELVIDVSLEDAQTRPDPRVIPTTHEALAGRIMRAQTRQEVVTGLVQPVLPETSLSLLLLPRDGLAVALAATGTALTAEQVRALVVPLDRPSLFQQAYSERQPVVGKADGDELQAMVAAYLEAPPPVGACVVPICVGRSVVNLLCVQLLSPAAPSLAKVLGELGDVAAAAYARLIGQRRLKR